MWLAWKLDLCNDVVKQNPMISVFRKLGSLKAYTINASPISKTLYYTGFTIFGAFARSAKYIKKAGTHQSPSSPESQNFQCQCFLRNTAGGSASSSHSISWLHINVFSLKKFTKNYRWTMLAQYLV